MDSAGNKKRKKASSSARQSAKGAQRAPPSSRASSSSSSAAPARFPEKHSKWKPTATRVRGAKYNPTDDVSILLFYHYVEPLWSTARRDDLQRYAVRGGISCNLGGRLRVACEGVNGTLSGTRQGLKQFCELLVKFDSSFANTDFKFIEAEYKDMFSDFEVLPVVELVYYGIGARQAPELTKAEDYHLPVEQFHAKMEQPNTVVIDVRNHYESSIGHFQPPTEKGGAELVDPLMRVSTEFPGWLKKEETKQKLKGKQVLMYCTGGIRCERASSMLRAELGDAVQGVYQLHGGIERYMQQFPTGGYWKGKNFVFDKRQAVAVPKAKSEEILTECSVCGVPWDQYLGARKCTSCKVPVLVCTKCLSSGVHKRRSLARYCMRCPLCKQENKLAAKQPGDKDMTAEDIEKELASLVAHAKAKARASSGAAAPTAGDAGSKKNKKKRQKKVKKKRKGQRGGDDSAGAGGGGKRSKVASDAGHKANAKAKKKAKQKRTTAEKAKALAILNALPI